MISIIVAGAVALFITLFFTPFFIRILQKRQYGQFIREDGPTSHLVKRGTPTMGGVIIIGASVLGFLLGNLATLRIPNISGWLIIFLLVGLGVIGFLDDFTKISKERSLGLSPRAKMLGQGIVGIIFAIGALNFADLNGQTPASLNISIVRNIPLTLGFAGIILGFILFILWTNFLITAWSNAVNLTDGLDGLAAGAASIAFGSYTVINIWQSYQRCGSALKIQLGCYDVRDPRDLAIFCAAIVGACLGFIWHNTSPAKIFMGDTGSLALGGAFAGVSILSQTEVLAILIGGLFVIIVISDVIQIGFFKATGKRVFRMAPLHHHFELKGWNEVTIVVRFWLIQIFLAAIGIGLFYTEWLSHQ